MKIMYDMVALLAILLLVACSGKGSSVTHPEDVDSSDSSSIGEGNGSSDKYSGKSSAKDNAESSSSISLWDWNSPKEELFNPDVEYGTLTDSRDGKTYRTVTFMFNDTSMTWLAENLNYSDSVQTPHLKGQMSCLEEDPDCRVAGRNYTWIAAMDTTDEYCGEEKYCGMTQDDHQGVCPDGWHLPSYREWEFLERFDTKSLLSTEAFDEDCKVGNNETGFSILRVAGSCRAVFWSASEYYEAKGWPYVVIWHGTAVMFDYRQRWERVGFRKNEKYPVRCVKNGEIRPYKNSWHWGLSKETFFNPDVEYGTLVDARDGQEYKTVVIGEGDDAQEWMAENLNYAVDSSKCYMNVPHYCDKVGRYYTYNQAMDSTIRWCSDSECGNYFRGEYQGICPEGWHIPSESEWDVLRQNMLGNPDVRYIGVVFPDEFKTEWKTSLYWEFDTIPNLNSTGFSVFPAGYWTTEDAYNEFVSFGYSAVFWMTDMSTWSARSMQIGSKIRVDYREKTDFMSVRCVKNRAQAVEID